MKLKNVITAGLLLFVAVALVVAVGKSFNGAAAPTTAQNAAESPSADSDVLPETQIPADGLTVVFFHGLSRCPTCIKMESYTHKVLDEAFADELQSGAIQWRTANYEDPRNKQLIDECEVFTSTVVLLRTEAGQRKAWKNPENRLWDLVDDEAAFKQFVQTEIKAMLNPQ